jgi:hypothetical protein
MAKCLYLRREQINMESIFTIVSQRTSRCSISRFAIQRSTWTTIMYIFNWGTENYGKDNLL